jgi:hypothetical protein
MFQFSNQLTQQITEVFKVDYGLELSEEVASGYLNSLAELFIAFGKEKND